MYFFILKVSISGEWVPWSAKVPHMEVETHKVASPDIVVPTLDTVRHEALLYTWLADHKPMGKLFIIQFKKNFNAEGSVQWIKYNWDPKSEHLC